MAEQLSYSEISCFLDCPRKYKYTYIDRCEPKRISGLMHFGKSLHRSIAKWIRTKDISAAKEEFLPSFDQCSGYATSDHACWYCMKKLELKKEVEYGSDENWATMMKKGIKLIDKLKECDFQPYEIDNSMLLEVKLEYNYNDILLKGYIDLIEYRSNQLVLIDHKTTSTSLTEKDLKRSMQLRFYIWLYEKVVGEKIRLAGFTNLVKTKEPKIKKIWTSFTEQDIMDCHEWVDYSINFYRFFTNQENFPKRLQVACSWCEWRFDCFEIYNNGGEF